MVPGLVIFTTRRFMSTLLKIECTITEELADEVGIFIASKVPHGWEETFIENGRKMTLYLEDHSFAFEMIKEFQSRFPDGTVVSSDEESEDWAMAW